jgi:hypothetical protein
MATVWIFGWIESTCVKNIFDGCPVFNESFVEDFANNFFYKGGGKTS